jgi:protein-tyrosine phosphatase
MAQRIAWQQADDQRDVIHRAAQALAEGKLVVFPTETVYGVAASAILPEAVERLIHCKGRPEDKPLTLALRSANEGLDWVPGMSPLGRRLSRRCWPGPVTLVFANGLAGGLAERLPDAVRTTVMPGGSLGLRVPAHEAIRQTMRLSPAPLVLTSANRSGQPAAVTGQEAADALGDGVDLVIDDGRCRYGQASSVVRVDETKWEMLREGVVPARLLERFSARVILLVCTGNTCRSPMAEALLKKLLAEKLGCSADDLPQRGYVVLSAGLSAAAGCRASEESLEVARRHGADLEGHLSQPLTTQLLAHADHIWTMTQSHLRALLSRYPRGGALPALLCPEGEDVPDPIGQDQQAYDECSAQILRSLHKRLAELIS